MTGHLMRPQWHRHIDGGWWALGPVQGNWGYGGGWRLYITWPFAKSWYFGTKAYG